MAAATLVVLVELVVVVAQVYSLRFLLFCLSFSLSLDSSVSGDADLVDLVQDAVSLKNTNKRKKHALACLFHYLRRFTISIISVAEFSAAFFMYLSNEIPELSPAISESERAMTNGTLN
ncbi:MAG: hypothetical protein K0R18_953 [Bacillales bacterium]|nr:hypothetical protein [Bacillales bacterium]